MMVFPVSTLNYCVSKCAANWLEINSNKKCILTPVCEYCWMWEKLSCVVCIIYNNLHPLSNFDCSNHLIITSISGGASSWNGPDESSTNKQMQIISNKAAQFTSTEWLALKVIHSLGQLLQVSGLHTVTKQKDEAVMTLLTILFTSSAVKYILLAFFSVWKQFVACDKDAYLSWTTVKVRFPRYYLTAARFRKWSLQNQK